jgi:hypothetical protein
MDDPMEPTAVVYACCNQTKILYLLKVRLPIFSNDVIRRVIREHLNEGKFG